MRIDMRYILRAEWVENIVLTYWKKQLDKRLYAVLPVLSELQQQDFITDTMVWWNSLQDISRRSTDGSGLPLPVYTGDLSDINKKGKRGMFQIVYLVRWWGSFAQESHLDVTK